MSRGRHHSIDEATLLETIATLADDGETLSGNGGVLPDRVAEELPFMAKSISKRCAHLADDGQLDMVWGLDGGQQRKSYLPAESDEPEIRCDGGSVDEALFEVIKERTKPEPDGITNANGNIWTGRTRLKQEASKGNVPCSRDEIADATERLIDAGRLISWHGLLAPATDEHLKAIIENERQSGFTRTLLIGKVNKMRGDSE